MSRVHTGSGPRPLPRAKGVSRWGSQRECENRVQEPQFPSSTATSSQEEKEELDDPFCGLRRPSSGRLPSHLPVHLPTPFVVTGRLSP